MLAIAFGKVNIILHLQECLLYKGIIFFSGWMISSLTWITNIAAAYS